MAWQVDPVVQETAEGEVITDFSITGDRRGLHRGMDPNWENDISVDNQGVTHHVFENVELNEEQANVFDTDEYVEAVQQAYPDVSEALEWGAKNLPGHRIDDYNAALDSDDPEQFMPLLEKLIAEYRNGVDAPEPEITDQEEAPEVEPPSDDEVESFIGELSQSEPQGEAVAGHWQDVANQAKAQGNEVYAGVAAATAAFEAGEVSAQEAIQFCLDNFDRNELAKVVRHIRS